MRKIFLLILLLPLTFQSFAQQRYSKQWILKAAGGMNVSSSGGVGELGLEYVFSRRSSLQASVFYNRNNYSCAIEEKIKVDNIGGYLHYSFAFMPTKPIRLILLGGAFLADQSVPGSAIEGVVIDAKSKTDVGLSFAGQIDFSVASRLSLYLQPMINWSFVSDVDRVYFLANLGLKVYF